MKEWMRHHFGLTNDHFLAFYFGVKFGAVITTAIFVAVALYLGGRHG